MIIPVTINMLELKDGDHAEGTVSFNGNEFKVTLSCHDGQGDGEPVVTIHGVDIGSLARAGFILDLKPLREHFMSLREESLASQREAERRFREKAYRGSRLHELSGVLGKAFQLISLEQFQKSRSGALYGRYVDHYRGHVKEISIFMNREQFVAYDYLNDAMIAGYATTPEEMAEIIADHRRHWRHKVDFFLAMQEHVVEGHPVPPEGLLRADEYIDQIQRKDTVSEAEIRRNHENYLREIGKLGLPDEVAEHARRHHDRTDTGTLETKRILGGLNSDHLARIRMLFRPRKKQFPTQRRKS